MYYILKDKTPIKEDDLYKWSRWFENISNRIVQQDVIDGKIKVSTVFLCIDHNWNNNGSPILFETMIFGLPKDYQERYCTWNEAEAGHQKALKIAKEKTGDL